VKHAPPITELAHRLNGEKGILMKKIIRGRVYDTQTATLIAEDGNNLSKRDFCWVNEELYRKKTGEFFLYGEGGPETKYCTRYADGMRGEGEDIIPLSYEQAQELVEKHCSASFYEEIFGPIVEEEGKSAITMYLSNTLIAKIKRAAQIDGVQISAYVEHILDAGITL